MNPKLKLVGDDVSNSVEIISVFVSVVDAQRCVLIPRGTSRTAFSARMLLNRYLTWTFVICSPVRHCFTHAMGTEPENRNGLNESQKRIPLFAFPCSLCNDYSPTVQHGLGHWPAHIHSSMPLDWGARVEWHSRHSLFGYVCDVRMHVASEWEMLDMRRISQNFVKLLIYIVTNRFVLCSIFYSIDPVLSWINNRITRKVLRRKTTVSWRKHHQFMWHHWRAITSAAQPPSLAPYQICPAAIVYRRHRQPVRPHLYCTTIISSTRPHRPHHR